MGGKSDDNRAQPTQQLVLREDARGSLKQICMNRNAQAALVEFEGFVSEKDCVAIFKAIGNLSHLTSLHIRSSVLPVTALTAIISHPTSLVTHLKLENVTLSSKTFADYMTLVECFRICSLRIIECIELAYCDFVDQTITIEPFLRALSTIPTLEQVSVVGTKILLPNDISSSWNCQPLLHLLPQLRSLHIESMPDIQHEQICILSEALENRFCTLRGLTLKNQKRMSHESIFRIAEMLEENVHLQELSLEVFCVEHVLWVVQALQNNKETNLKRLTFVGDWDSGDEDEDDDQAEEREELKNELRALLKMKHIQLEKLDFGNGDHQALSKEMAVYLDRKKKSRGKDLRQRLSSDHCAATATIGSPGSFGSSGTGLMNIASVAQAPRRVRA